MNNFTKKDKSQIFFRRVIFSIPFLIFLFIIFLFFSISTLRIYFQSKEIREERKEKEALLKIEEEKNKELERKIAELQTDKGLEKKLREKFQIKKPGEQVVVILNPEKTNRADNVSAGENFLKRIFNWWLGR